MIKFVWLQEDEYNWAYTCSQYWLQPQEASYTCKNVLFYSSKCAHQGQIPLLVLACFKSKLAKGVMFTLVDRLAGFSVSLSTCPGLFSLNHFPLEWVHISFHKLKTNLYGIKVKNKFVWHQYNRKEPYQIFVLLKNINSFEKMNIFFISPIALCQQIIMYVGMQ